MVTRIDRLARSSGGLQDTLSALKAMEQPVDTSTAAGKGFLDMPGGLAGFETNPCRERQAEGNAEGVYKGHWSVIDVAVRRELPGQGLGATGIAAKPGNRRASVDRLTRDVLASADA